ncbi:MAG TPA: transcriptional regulator ArgP [Nocardioides bacterium]|uniref:LysR family transcriptional regulator ArgP n=1 Tax=uncultured Nocardioides sp. TaxID=198441 RepID=UPI000ECFE917|nr:LysR family transcriptional regulator ArgP [uncultured Nocardioides sp.]HCB06118.1 transcriptional regulator ArgP [Nocardioides sp.]HRD61408.1 LysR family transcriptional regulator ArgP [Nocardioides sp.]
MSYNAAGVEALVAIADHGTFDAAARALHVTPSAVSQRIRALESEVGHVVVRRGTPCEPTVVGAALVRLGRQTRLLDDETRAAVEAQSDRVEVAVAVNADSLATWFRDVLMEVATQDELVVRLVVEDQAYSAELLRSGDVLAAVTSDPQPVQGCRTEHLGFLRYRPAATPELAERWRRGRGQDWQRMPVVVFNAKDALQHDVLRDRGVTAPDVVHLVPTSADFHEAVRLGLGWGMLPEPQLLPDLASGRLVTLGGRTHHDVHLHWQRWRIDSSTLASLSDAVSRAAGDHLRR